MKNVFIKDKRRFAAKLDALEKGGAESLHIITDFDRTLTKDKPETGKSGNSYELMNACVDNPDFLRKIQSLFEYYYQIEISPSMSIQKKISYMEEWWEKYWNLTIEYGITRQKLLDGVKRTRADFRIGFEELLGLLHEKEIPLLIFSAGSGDLIVFYLEMMRMMTPNVHIVSNFYKFGRNGEAKGYNRPLIHTFNKNEKQVKSEAYEKKIEKRKNVILLGDSIGDVTMASGLSHECILKIGFLSSSNEKRLEEYSEHFDMLIRDDGSLEHVNEIIRAVFGNGKNGNKRSK